MAQLTMKTDDASRLAIKEFQAVVLTRDYAGHARGTHFIVANIIECESGDYLRYNAQVVYPDEPVSDRFFWRMLPAEYLAPIPAFGDTFLVNFNQGDRHAKVLAVIGDEMLYDYEMPGGKVFMRIAPIQGGGGRSVSEASLPKKWRDAIEND
jgi:hypothetical protein